MNLLPKEWIAWLFSTIAAALTMAAWAVNNFESKDTANDLKQDIRELRADIKDLRNDLRNFHSN